MVEPNAGARARYDAGYALYRDLYAALEPLFPRMIGDEGAAR